MINETLGLEFLIASDPSALRIVNSIFSIVWMLIEKRYHLGNLPPHARILPPPRIRYTDQLRMLHEWSYGGAFRSRRRQTGLPGSVFGLLLAGRKRRLERFRRSLSKTHRYTDTGTPDSALLLDKIVRNDVDLVISGHWRSPSLYPTKNGACLHACCGLWDTGIDLGPEHAHDPVLFGRICTALLEGSIDSLVDVENLVTPRYVVRASQSSGGVAVQMLEYARRASRFLNVGETQRHLVQTV